jgi:hypothetical protein
MDLTALIGTARAATDANIRDKVLMIDVSVTNPCGDTAISKSHSNTVAVPKLKLTKLHSILVLSVQLHLPLQQLRLKP